MQLLIKKVMTIDKIMTDDLKPMTKLLGGLSMFVIGAGYVSNFLGFKDGFDDICYCAGVTGLLTSLIIYKSCTKQL